jgi:hypothetical protein
MISIAEASMTAASDNRRRAFRHREIDAEVMIFGKVYRLVDWSASGIAFEAVAQETEFSRLVRNNFSAAAFQGGDEVQLTLLFHFPHETMAIRQKAHIVRQDGVLNAAAFIGISEANRREFARVVDRINAESFLGSQVA